jgi:integrase
LVRDIGAAELKEYSRWRSTVSRSKYGNKNGVSQRSINDDLTLIRSAFNAAGENFDLPKMPQFKRLIIGAAETERDRLCTIQEETDLLDLCFDGFETVECKRYEKTHFQKVAVERSHLRAIIIFAIETAARRSEIFSLDWQDVDLDNNLIKLTATKTKTNRFRFVPITPRLKRELLTLPHRDGYVFAGNDIDRPWETLKARAAIGDLHFHDLRHTAITRMIRAGMPHMEAMKISGHTQIKTFQRYLNISAAAVQELGDRIDVYLTVNSLATADAIAGNTQTFAASVH